MSTAVVLSLKSLKKIFRLVKSSLSLNCAPYLPDEYLGNSSLSRINSTRFILFLKSAVLNTLSASGRSGYFEILYAERLREFPVIRVYEVAGDKSAGIVIKLVFPYKPQRCIIEEYDQ